MHSALKQNLPATAGTFSRSRARWYTRPSILTLPDICPDLNPISLFGIILHAPPDSTAFLAVNVVNFTSVSETGRRLSDRFAEHHCPVKKQ